MEHVRACREKRETGDAGVDSRAAEQHVADEPVKLLLVVCVHTHTQLLTLLSCTYISLTEIIKDFVAAKHDMTVRVDAGPYHKAFVVLDTKKFVSQGDFQK